MVNPLHTAMRAATAAAKAKKGKTTPPAEEKESFFGKISGFFKQRRKAQFEKGILKDIKKQERDIHKIFALFELRDRAFEKRDYKETISIINNIIEIIRKNLNIDKKICVYEASYFNDQIRKYESEESRMERHGFLFAGSARIKEDVKEYDLKKEINLLKQVISELENLIYQLLAQKDSFKQNRYENPDLTVKLKKIKTKLIDLEIVDKALIEEEMKKAA